MSELIADETSAHKGLDILQAQDFKPYIGEEFTIFFTNEVKAKALLDTVLELPGHTDLERKPFSILLKTDLPGTSYPQAIYSIEHHALGTLNIFLVPVGINGKGIQYEAVFS